LILSLLFAAAFSLDKIVDVAASVDCLLQEHYHVPTGGCYAVPDIMAPGAADLRNTASHIAVLQSICKYVLCPSSFPMHLVQFAKTIMFITILTI
jgi:hypothetical protein